MIQCNRVFSYKELYQFFDVYDDKKLNNDVNKCMNVRLSCLILSLNVGNFLQFYLNTKVHLFLCRLIISTNMSEVN